MTTGSPEPLTTAQQELYDWLSDYICSHRHSPSIRQMMQAMNQEMPGADPVEIELNPRHDLIKKLAATSAKDKELAGLVADQLYDNAMLSAGLLEDSKDMVNRLNTLLEKAMG